MVRQLLLGIATAACHLTPNGRNGVRAPLADANHAYKLPETRVTRSYSEAAEVGAAEMVVREGGEGIEAGDA